MSIKTTPTKIFISTFCSKVDNVFLRALEDQLYISVHTCGVNLAKPKYNIKLQIFLSLLSSIVFN